VRSSRLHSCTHGWNFLALDEILAFDSQALRDSSSAAVSSVVGDITNANAVRDLLDDEDCSVFHLASVVSHGAEQDFDLAMDVNLRGGLNVLEACRALPSTPRLVFASRFAPYGGEQPPSEVDDETRLTPRTTYGATKAIAELLVNEYSRKGFLDGRTARLPTVVSRPGPAEPCCILLV
jgi:nucleoside-diphosphate-sugar epimerase